VDLGGEAKMLSNATAQVISANTSVLVFSGRTVMQTGCVKPEEIRRLVICYFGGVGRRVSQWRD